MTDARSRLADALSTSDPAAAVLALARLLRDEGMGQVALYRLFAEQQQRLWGKGPRYDAIVDTMDLIWGGPWAKGHALFDEEISSGRIDRE
jgi:hypothetical protein